MSDAAKDTTKDTAIRSKLPSREVASPKSDTPNGDTPNSDTLKSDTPKSEKKNSPIVDNMQGYIEMSGEDLTSAYESFKKLEELKAAVADGFPPDFAMALEATGEGRKPWIGYLRNVLDSLREDSLKNQAPNPKLRSAAEVAEDKYANVTGKDLVDALRQGEVMFQRERLENPAIPLDAGSIIDFPRELIYKWVPAPPKHRAYTPDETANLEGFIRKGWRFYSPDLMRQSPNMRGLPWKLGWEPEGDKVRWQDQWLMIRFRDQEMHDRAMAIAKSNAKGKTDIGRHKGIDSTGSEYEYVVHSTGGESTVDKVLREKPDTLDALDNSFPGLEK